MMGFSNRSKPPTAIRCVSGALLSFVLLTTPAAVLAHGGHGEDFQAGSEATGASDSIQVDAQTAKRIGIKVEPVTSQRLAVGIKTTGQIETLPNQKVEVTAPLTSTVIQLLVQPGDAVKKSQPVAVISSPELVQLRVDSEQKRAEAEADLQQAQANLKLAQQNYQRFTQIAAAEIAQAQSQVNFAQEKSDKDRVLLAKGAIPRRTALESQTQLAEAQANFTTASSRRDVLAAEAELKRAQSAVEVAKSRIRLSSTTYQTRLKQLGTRANALGQVTITAPIAGTVADREISQGQSLQDAGGKLMTIVNDTQVFATANIYEKDLDKVKTGQPVSVKVASVPNRTFTGRITRIGSVVEGETRVVPVQAQLDNSSGQLKPGMFAELEVITDRTPKAILAIPSVAVVEANGKQVVYVQNGNAFQPVEVTLGQTSGDMVEVKSGLFEGDAIVTQRAPQLYAQSLRGGSKKEAPSADPDGGADEPKPSNQGNPVSTPAGTQLPWWLAGAAGGLAIGTAAFMAGVRSGRRNKPQLVHTSTESAYTSEEFSQGEVHNGHHVATPDSHLGAADESSESIDNHHPKSQDAEIKSKYYFRGDSRQN